MPGQRPKQGAMGAPWRSIYIEGTMGRLLSGGDVLEYEGVSQGLTSRRQRQKWDWKRV